MQMIVETRLVDDVQETDGRDVGHFKRWYPPEARLATINLAA